jgi:hypothetical protein
LEPKKGTIIRDIQSGEETIEFLPQGNGDDMTAWDEMEEENATAVEDLKKAKKISEQ